MNQLLPAVAVALVLTGSASTAGAATQLGDYFSIGGFGTAGGVKTNSDEARYGRDRQLGGADKTVNFGVDSDLGVQLTGTATNWLSGTVQVLAERRDDSRIETRFEWAFVTVKPLDGLSIRGGRMATPAFLISDSRNIGYANTWVRAPNEVYGLNVFRTFEGADATYRLPVGPVSLSLNVLAGKTTFKPLGGDASGKDLKGANLLLESDWANFRIGRLKTDVAVPAFAIVGDPYTFTGYAVAVDRDNIVAQAEFVQRRSGKAATSSNADGWYVLGGYHFGQVLPYLIVSRTAPKFAGQPFYLSATQQTTAVGVRWDAFKSADIKFQVDHTNAEHSSGISFTNPGSPFGAFGVYGTALPHPVNVFSLAVDFTF